VSIAEFVTTTPRRQTARPRAPAALPQFPAIEPGELWLIEVSVDGALSASARHAVDDSNVVIYDRVLAGTLSGALPLGTYAEAGESTDQANDPAAARAVRFACDGWSVARLVPAGPTQRQRIVRVRRLIEELAAAKPAAEIAVTVYGELKDGVCEPTETWLSRLDQVVVTYPRDARLTIVVSGVSGHLAAGRVQAIAGNGLAG
jgi:hypothetical protein